MPPVAIPLAIGVGTAAYASSQQKKAQKQAQSFAEQQAADARAEQQRLEEKYGLTPGELERQDRMFGLEKSQQAEFERRAGLSGEELLKESGPTSTGVINRVNERLGKTSSQLFAEEGGAPAQLLLEELSRPGPTDMFKGELDLVLQEVNKAANRRGVYGGLPEGGIRFENLGRAGVDLAIKSARERLEQRGSIANTLFNISSGARSEAGTVAERSLAEKEGARNDLNAFLTNQQNLDAASKGRAASVGTSAFGTAQNTVNQANQVPIEIAGFNASQAAQNKANVLNTLGDLGGLYLQNKYPDTFGENKNTTFGGDILSKSRTEEDPLERLWAYRGRTPPMNPGY